jgi:hypothetical protein
VNLSAVFASAGAAQDAIHHPNTSEQFATRIQNAKRIAEIASAAGWHPCRPDQSLQSGILLLEAAAPPAERKPAEETRAALQKKGVVATVYDGGTIRLSMPAGPLRAGELATVTAALSAIL